MCLESRPSAVLQGDVKAKQGPDRRPAPGQYFSQSEIHQLCNYKNLGSDMSVTYRYVLSPIYDRLVPLLPMWLAPNMVTLCGLMCVVVSHFVVMFYSPTLSEVAPRWVYLLLWVGLVLYMTLDNLDGRQARRTKTSSPLGHLFDHGCDTLNVFLSGLNLAAALLLGNNIWTLLQVWGAGMMLFFSATLEEYFNGALNLGYINGPNEGLLIMQGILLVSAVFGAETWTAKVAIGPWLVTSGHLFVYILIPLAIPTAVANYVSIINGAERGQVVRRIMECARSSTPFVVFSVCMFAWQQTSDAFAQFPYLFMWCVGINFFYLISRLIVAHLTHADYPAFMAMSLPMVAGAGNAVAGWLVGSPHGLVDQRLLLWALLTVNLVVCARRVYGITQEICSHLGIRCFTIAPRDAESQD